MGNQEKSDRILVGRLAELYDPFVHLGLTKSHRKLVKKSKEIKKYVNDDVRDIDYHLGRILFFKQEFERFNPVQPIVIDNECNGGFVYPYPIVIDGHHRLGGAVLAGIEHIYCSYGGRRDLLHYLMGKTDVRPDE